MKIIALFLALGLERLATQLFHWRDLRWLDPLIDRGIALSNRWQQLPYLWVIATLALAVAPVVIAHVALAHALLGLPYLALSVLVLFLCLGPEDIGEEVNRWRDAIESGDSAAERTYARALLERGFNDTRGVRGDVPGAVFVQANNRMYAVIFWFVILGPIGAWLFRVADLVRRRALFQAQRAAPDTDVAMDCDRRAEQVHALLAWLPARLSALGYTLAGSYDRGRDAWRGVTAAGAARLAAGNENLLRSVGLAALHIDRAADEDDSRYVTRVARAAKNLVLRTLMFWLVGVALLTLAGLAV